MKMLGIILLVLGLFALVYQSFTYSQPKQDAKIGSLTLQHNEIETVPIPPIIGGIFIVAGVAALYIGSRRNV